LHLGSGKARKLRQKLRAALADFLVEFRAMIGEKKERAGGAEFLALKEHGRAGCKQRQCGDGAELAW
jgi:hypothetical protein